MRDNLNSFNYWVGCALTELTKLALYRTAVVRRSVLDTVLFYLGHSLKAANRMQCAARQAVCMRVMNWLRADMRRLPA